MTLQLNLLITALREELQHYGDMLAQLDRQQELVIARASNDLLISTNAVQDQAHAIQLARTHRSTIQSTIATSLQLPVDTPFTSLIPLLPADYRPLIKALVDENNQLLARVQHRARQNHLLLTRSLDLMQRFLATLFPSPESHAYTDSGQRLAPAIPFQPLYEAVG